MSEWSPEKSAPITGKLCESHQFVLTYKNTFVRFFHTRQMFVAMKTNVCCNKDCCNINKKVLSKRRKKRGVNICIENKTNGNKNTHKIKVKFTQR